MWKAGKLPGFFVSIDSVCTPLASLARYARKEKDQKKE